MMVSVGYSLAGNLRPVLVIAGIAFCAGPAWPADLPDTSFETVPAAEAGEIEETVALGVKLQDKRAQLDESQKGRLLRGVHAKSHGCVRADFVVNNDLDERYRVGLFAQAGRKYDAWIRFSNASVLREDDLKANREGERQNGSRGMAIKVMDVEGEVLSQDAGSGNQDFLMINTAEFAFANVRDYLRLNRILVRSPKGDVAAPYFFPAILAQLGVPAVGEPAGVTARREAIQDAVQQDPLLNALSEDDMKGTFASAGVVAKVTARTVRNPMQAQYFGAAPFLFGEGQVMKFSAAPCAPESQEPFTTITADEPPANYLRAALTRTMMGDKAVCYDFKIHTREINDEELNVEDATTTWPDELSGYVGVARMIINVPQSPQSPEAVEQCETLAFTPWHALTVHRPLGGINRLRRKVYSESARHRNADGY